MNYKRLTEIDEEIEKLNQLVKDLPGGYHSSSVFGVQIGKRSYKIVVKAEGDVFGLSWADKIEWKVMAEVVIEKIMEKIKQLEQEKNKLLNKRWWQVWIK